MPIRFTAEQFCDALQRDRTWRIKEVDGLRTLLSSSHQSETVLLRALWVILYAHWEGYIRYCVQEYLSYISSKRLRFKNLRLNFSLLAASTLLDRLSINSPHGDKINTLQAVLLLPEEVNKSKYSAQIRTNGNLNAKVFCNLCHTVGLSPDNYGEHFLNFLDEILLANRNSIAHGQSSRVTQKALDEAIPLVLGAMRQFSNDLQNAAVLEHYRS